jgi:DNA-binding transcriptional ArsR family regulator
MPDIDLILFALADPARRRGVELLRAGPQRPGALADALALSRPAMSRHLRVLRSAALVEIDELDGDARGRLVRICPAPFAALRAWVAETEALWNDQLSAFVAYAEAQGERSGGGEGPR